MAQMAKVSPLSFSAHKSMRLTETGDRMDIVKREKNGMPESHVKDLKSYCVLLNKLATAFSHPMDTKKQAVYLENLQDLTEQNFSDAIHLAIKRNKFFPTVSELREYAIECALERHRLIAATRTRPEPSDRSDDWNFKAQDVFEEIDQKNAELYERDKVFPLSESDHVWPKLQRTEKRCGCPKHHQATDEIWWVCYARIRDAKNGVPLKPVSQLAKEHGLGAILLKGNK